MFGTLGTVSDYMGQYWGFRIVDHQPYAFPDVMAYNAQAGYDIDNGT